VSEGFGGHWYRVEVTCPFVEADAVDAVGTVGLEKPFAFFGLATEGDIVDATL